MIVVILKWISQVLIVIGGITGLLSEAYKTDPSTGKRSLTRVGWVTVTTLLLGFLLFVSTDIKERRENAERDVAQKQQISSLQEIVKGQNEQISLSKGIVASQQEQLSISKQLDESQQQQLLLSKGLTEAQKKQLSLSGSLVESQRKQLTISGSLIEEQKRQIQQLDKISLDRDLTGVEVSFKPSTEHWRKIEAAYEKITLKSSLDFSYTPYFRLSTMTAEKFGDHWRISFTPVVRPLGTLLIPSVVTNRPDGQAFEDVLRAALIYLSINWGDGLEAQLSAGRNYPTYISVSRRAIIFTLHPPDIRLSLSVLNDNPRITFKGWNYPSSIRVRSLDRGVAFDQTIDANWKEDNDMNWEEVLPSVSGPHQLKIIFRNISP